MRAESITSLAFLILPFYSYFLLCFFSRLLCCVKRGAWHPQTLNCNNASSKFDEVKNCELCNNENVLHPFKKLPDLNRMSTAGGEYNKVEPENKMEAGHGSCPH